MERKKVVQAVSIIAASAALAMVVAWSYMRKDGAVPGASSSDVPTSAPQSVPDMPHVVFTREVDGVNHVIYDGRDLGEISDNWPVISGDHLAFQRSVDGKEHVIYDGRDLGEGFRVGLDGDHVTFVREIEGKPHVIHDGTDFGEVASGQDYQYSVHGDTVALAREVGGKSHLFINGQDQGEVGADFEVGAGGVAFLQHLVGEDHVVFAGKDYGKGWQIEGVSAGHVFYSKQGETIGDGTWYNDFFRDGEYLGSGQAITIADDDSHYAIQKQVSLGQGSFENRVLYDGRDVGKLGDTLNIFMSGDHVAYYRDVDGEQHVIYDGDDMGAGDNISLSGNHFAFARKVGAEWHVISDGQDIGIGSYPRILGRDIVVQRLVDGEAHLFLNGADLGRCGSRAYGTQTDDCWPDLSR